MVGERDWLKEEVKIYGAVEVYDYGGFLGGLKAFFLELVWGFVEV